VNFGFSGIALHSIIVIIINNSSSKSSNSSRLACTGSAFARQFVLKRLCQFSDVELLSG
jgi:hypothetical protein